MSVQHLNCAHRSSHSEVFLKLSQNSQESTCASLFFNKVAGLRSETLALFFPVNFAKFLRTPFILEYLWWLFLSTIQISFTWDIIKHSGKQGFLFYQNWHNQGAWHLLRSVQQLLNAICVAVVSSLSISYMNLIYLRIALFHYTTSYTLTKTLIFNNFSCIVK